MKHASLQKHLRHAPHDIYDLIMDVGSYPAIYPMVKTARITAINLATRDVEMEFNLPAVLGISNPVQVSRVTGVTPTDIHVMTLKSPLKALDMHWQLAAQGVGTLLTFNMAYETGRGFLVDSFLQAAINNIMHDTLQRFEVHAARVLAVKPALAASRKKGHSPGSP